MFKLYIRLELTKVFGHAADSEEVRVNATVRLFACFGGAVSETQPGWLSRTDGYPLLPCFCLAAALLISYVCLGLPCILPYWDLQDSEAVVSVAM